MCNGATQGILNFVSDWYTQIQSQTIQQNPVLKVNAEQRYRTKSMWACVDVYTIVIWLVIFDPL